MSLKVGIRSLSKVLHNSWILRSVPSAKLPKSAAYSTTVSKPYIDILDLFTDLLKFNDEHPQSERNVLQSLTKELSPKLDDEKLFENINFADKIAAKNVLDEILQKNILDQNWCNVARVTEVFMNESIPMERNNMQSLIILFSNSGFLKGLLQLRVIMCTSHPESYLEKGELLVPLATCYWITGNSSECLICMKEFFTRYPELKDSAKVNFKTIIREAIVKQNEAQLNYMVSIVEDYTHQNNDFYFIVALWNYLFSSEWYMDHHLANDLLYRHKELRSLISLMSSSLAHHFAKSNRAEDIYRLMQVFLKYDLKDSYAIASQILFDYYLQKGNQFACSEMVKASIRLKLPLRQEQYNYFISWCATGDPYKYISSSEIERIYSNF